MEIIDGVLKSISPMDIKDGKIVIPEGVKKIDKYVFYNNEVITEIVLPESLIEIDNYAFENCVMLKKIVFPKKLERIGESSFRSCFSLESIILNDNLKSINKDAFSLCLFLNNVIIPKNVVMDEGAFSSLNYSYYKDDKVLFSNDEIKTNKTEIVLPVDFITLISNKENIYDFYNNSDFTSFNSNLSNIVDSWKDNCMYDLSDPDFIIKELNINRLIDGDKVYEKKNYTYKDETVNLYKFIYLLGCFSKEKYNKDCTISQKSSSLFAKINKSNILYKKYYKLFNMLDINNNISDETINFISHQNKNEFDNIELLLELEKEYSGIFAMALTNFKEIKNYRNGIDSNGKNYIVPWREALINYHNNNRFINTTEDNNDIAKVFNSFGLNQKIYEEAVRIRKIFKNNNIVNNILGKELKEESMAETIYKAKSIDSDISTKDFANKLYEKQFTYEWLDKSRPENFILGLYCSCCANITGNSYGSSIAKSSIISNDVQNLVIKDINNTIIGKATMYINRKEGYAVINDFEINKKYRYGESETNPGIYLYEYKDENTPKEKKYSEYRKLIFKAFKRGIEDFLNEYNKDHAVRITKVNIGMGANRLKNFVLNYEPELDENKLVVPKEYSFDDATLNHQYTLVKVV